MLVWGRENATPKRSIWETFIEKTAFDLALRRQEEKGVGGGPSGTDRINNSRKLGKHSSRNGVYRESVMGIGECGEEVGRIIQKAEWEGC